MIRSLKSGDIDAAIALTEGIVLSTVYLMYRYLEYFAFRGNSDHEDGWVLHKVLLVLEYLDCWQVTYEIYQGSLWCKNWHQSLWKWQSYHCRSYGFRTRME